MEWSLEAVSAVAGEQGGASPVGSLASVSTEGVFGRAIERELADLNASVVAAEGAIRDVAAGKPVEMHDVMIRLEQARISVQAFVQIRNKVVESYQDLMRMQM